VVLSASQLEKELGNSGVELSPPPVDSFYRVVPGKWYVKKFLPWWWEYRKAFDFYSGGWTAEVNDCDDYAYRFRQALRDSNALRPKKGRCSVAVGVAVVRMRYSSMGVESGGLHACNLLCLDKEGWVVVEPQNSQQVRLSAYPNSFVRAEF
jgi:hypothetical protein